MFVRRIRRSTCSALQPYTIDSLLNFMEPPSNANIQLNLVTGGTSTAMENVDTESIFTVILTLPFHHD